MYNKHVLTNTVLSHRFPIFLFVWFLKNKEKNLVYKSKNIDIAALLYWFAYLLIRLHVLVIID